MQTLRTAGLALATLTLAGLTATGASAQTFVQTTVTDSGQTAPAGIISQLDNSGTVSGSMDYTNNPTPGQSFTPTSSFLLTGITVQTNGSLGLTQSENIDLRLTTVNADNTLTNIIAVYANNTPIAFAANNDYITFDLTPATVTLTAGTEYAFDIRTQSDSYLGLNHSSTDVYPGGFAFNGTDGAGQFGNSAVTTQSYDRTFVISGTPTAAPEPSQAAAFSLGLLGLGGLALRARKRAPSL